MASIIDKIVAEAKLEDEACKRNRKYRNLGLKTAHEKMGITENTLVSPYTTHIIMNIHDEPVSAVTFQSGDPDVRATNGCYTLQYLPRTDRRSIPGKPYIIGQDLIRMRICVSGPDHFNRLASRIPELAWMRRNTTISNELFGFAKMHPGIPLYFTIDWVKYGGKIIKKAEKAGLDINHKPFVAYCCSKSTFETMFKGKELCEKKTDKDYAQEIFEIDNECVYKKKK